MHRIPYVLTISGSDSSGCSGMQADNRAIHAAGAMPLNVITANTLQTPGGVVSIDLVDVTTVERQLRTLLEAYPVQAIKIGMLGSAATVGAVAAVLAANRGCMVVLDPVLKASSGAELLDDAGRKALNGQLLQHVDLVTPNLEEREQIEVPETCACLVKGGHGSGAESVDELTLADGSRHELRGPRVRTGNDRGTGCVLSAAIAAYLAQGSDLAEACTRAKALLTDSLQRNTGRRFVGRGPAFPGCE